MSTRPHQLPVPSQVPCPYRGSQTRYTVAKLKRVKKARARFPQLFRSALSGTPNRQKPRTAKTYIRTKSRTSTEATVQAVCPMALMSVCKAQALGLGQAARLGWTQRTGVQPVPTPAAPESSALPGTWQMLHKWLDE